MDGEGIGLGQVLGLLIVLGGFLALTWYLRARSQHGVAAGASRAYVCTQCGFLGLPSWKVPGSTAITLILVWFAVVPAIIYSIWRNSNRFPACPQCGAPRSMIPSDSEMGRRYTREPQGITLTESSPARQERACPWCAEVILAQARVCKHCGREVISA